MPWSKLKNIILVILAVTNLCLLLLVMGPGFQRRLLRGQVLDNAVRFLQDRGVQLDEDLGTPSITLSPQVVQRNLEEEARAAAALLGEGVQSEARGGEVYRYYNQNGAVQFHSDGAFSAEFAPGVFPLGEAPAQTGLALLERLGFQALLLEQEEDRLTFRQLWQDAPIFSHQVTLVCEDGCAAALLGGRRLVGAPAEDPSRTVITPATALIDFLNGVTALGDVCSRIDAIEQGYVGAAALSGFMTLTPVWRITTDTGVYQLDTVTGQVSRMS